LPGLDALMGQHQKHDKNDRENRRNTTPSSENAIFHDSLPPPMPESSGLKRKSLGNSAHLASILFAQRGNPKIGPTMLLFRIPAKTKGQKNRIYRLGKM
jgi:hypothetical protein